MVDVGEMPRIPFFKIIKDSAQRFPSKIAYDICVSPRLRASVAKKAGLCGINYVVCANY